MATAYVGVKEGTDKKIATHSFTENGTEKHVERIALATGILALPDTPQIDTVNTEGIYPDTSIDCEGKGFIVIKTTYSTAETIAYLRVAFYDLNDQLIGFSPTITIPNTGQQENTRYVGEVTVVQNIGAKSIKFLVSPVNGDVSLFIGVV